MTATRPAPAPPRPQEPAPDGFGNPPRPRATRNAAGILLGLLLIAFCAAGVAAYTASLGHRQSVLVVVRAVDAGSVVTDADLGEARLPRAAALRAVAASERRRVVGRVAAVSIVPGTLLAEAELATRPLIDADHAVVGLALKAGQFPAGLRPLDPVSVIETSPSSSVGPPDASVLVDNTEVISSALAADGQTTVVSVLVPRAVAAGVAGAAARGQVSLALLGHA